MTLNINNNLYYNKMTETILLNKSFDLTEDLIKKNPENENNIINDFNKYIIKIKSNYNPDKTYVRSATFKDDVLNNHNEIIKIHNNFQKYNNNDNNDNDTTYEPFTNINTNNNILNYLTTLSQSWI